MSATNLPAGEATNPATPAVPKPTTPQDAGKPATPQQKPSLATITTEAAKPEAKTDGKAPVEPAVDSKEAPKTGAPDKYEFKPAEGEAPYAPEVTKAFEAVARDLGLPNDGANKVLQTMRPVLQAAFKQQLDAQVSEWRAQLEAHPTLGGTPAKLEASLKIAAKAFDLAPAGIRKVLIDSGLVEHPEFAEWNHKLGSAMTEDRFRTGAAPKPEGTTPKGNTNADIANRWYGKKKTG